MNWAATVAMKRVSMDLAPIAVFAYRRTKHLAATLDALESCPEFSESPVFIWSDGPKSTADKADVSSVRKLVKSRLRSNMTLNEASENQGIATSIIGGVQKLCDQFGKVIVIEDDLVVSPITLTWFNAALRRFADAEEVWQVSAYQHPVAEFSQYTHGVFCNLTTSWGWATWKRAWDLFDIDATGSDMLRSDPNMRHRFNVNNAYPYAEILEAQMGSTVDKWDWDIRFWWTVFQAGGVGLFPPRSLVMNIGFDDTATHRELGWLRRYFRPRMHPPTESAIPTLPTEIIVRSQDTEALSRALRGARTIGQKMPWVRDLLRGAKIGRTWEL